MRARWLLLGTTALSLGLATQAPRAAEIRPLGALDLEIGGFMRWYALGGHIGGKTQERSSARDFRNDTEVFVYAAATDEATGLRYGARIELEADTNTTANADETYVFLEGRFGELRFGDKDGAGEAQQIGAFTFAAFSGGIDGVGPIDLGAAVDGPDSDDATKIIYISPTLAGLNAILSYAPHVGSAGQNLAATDDDDVKDLLEAGVAYNGTFGGLEVLGSIIGHYGRFNARQSGSGGRDTYKVYGGLNLGYAGVIVGGGWGYVQGGGISIADNAGDAIFLRGAKAQWYNIGAAVALGAANVSINLGHVYDSDQSTASGGSPEPWEVVLGADFGLAPGIVLGAEIAYFDLDLDKADRQRADRGVLGLVGIRTAF